jgi:hypothetical protein
MADDLVLELVGAMRNASLGEVSSLLESLEREQRTRPRTPAPRLTTSQRRRPSPQPSPSKRDAFEITMPHELLDSVGKTPARAEDEMPPASVQRVRPANGRGPTPRIPRMLETPAAPPPPAPESTPSVEEKEPRPPIVPLREGEQVVRASGSGVVIRRVRSA